jgi:beta-lactamase regulating signal transducer with metallopeptidase domain
VSWQLVPLFLVVFGADLVLGRRLWSELRAALWLLVPLKLVLPPTLVSPLGLSAGSVLSFEAARPVVPSTSSLLEEGAFLLWIVVGSILALVGARRHRANLARIRGKARKPEPVLATVAARAARLVGLRRLPRLCVSEAVAGPCVVGVLTPLVVLPSWMAGIGERALLHVLLHEMAHVKRRDPFRAVVLTTLQIVFWFHPAVWIAASRLRTLRELACDRMAASSLRSDASTYRETLLAFARTMVETGGRLGALGFRTRIRERLLLCPREEARPAPWRRLVTLGLFVLLALVALPLGSAAVAVRPSLDRAPLEASEHRPFPGNLPGCLALRYVVLGHMAREGGVPDATPNR